MDAYIKHGFHKNEVSGQVPPPLLDWNSHTDNIHAIIARKFFFFFSETGMFIEPSDNFLKINLHLSWYNFYYVHNFCPIYCAISFSFFRKKKKHTDSEVTKTHVSNRHYRVNLVTAGTAKLLFKPSVWKGQPIRIRQL